jgi:hypothetical protein
MTRVTGVLFALSSSSSFDSFRAEATSASAISFSAPKFRQQPPAIAGTIEISACAPTGVCN